MAEKRKVIISLLSLRLSNPAATPFAPPSGCSLKRAQSTLTFESWHQAVSDFRWRTFASKGREGGGEKGKARGQHAAGQAASTRGERVGSAAIFLESGRRDPFYGQSAYTGEK